MTNEHDGALVIDADGHVMEPDDCWTDRMDPDRWGDWIPRKITEDGCYETIWTGGVIRGGGRELHDQMAAAVGLSPQELYDLMSSLRVDGGHDPDARVRDLDGDGIDAAVVYPSQGMFFGPCDPIPALHDIEFVADCQRAYNDWVAEFCAAHPRRLFGVAGVPLQDVDRAIREAQRACGDLGLVAVFLRPSAYLEDGGRELPFHHPAYDPFWAAMAELGVPVAFHPGVHIDTPGACRKFGLVAESENMSVTNMATDDIHGGSALGQAVGNAVDMIVTMGWMLMGGVCERFPDLKLLFLESGGGWVPTQLERMDEQVQAFPLERRKLAILPSEYFRRQCWVCFEAEEWNLAACAERLGADRVLWATDYPHPEYHAGVVDELREHLAPLADDARTRILGQNAVAAYDLAL